MARPALVAARPRFGLVLSAVLGGLPSLAWAQVPDGVENPVRGGIRSIYAMDFAGAEEQFKKAIAFDPEHPYGYYGKAIASWALYVYGSQQTDPAQKAKFERDLDTSIVKARAWLKKAPKDAYVHLCLGGSYGLRSRLSVIERRWLRAMWDGLEAIKLTRKARKLDPGNQDALFGIGMYDYYADALPRFISALGRFVLGGSRERGIRELEAAAKGGKYVDVGAKLILIEIYTEDRWGAKDPAKGVKMIEELREQFPRSPMFHQIEHVCLFEAGRLDELEASVGEYLKRIDEGWPYYPASDRARMFVSLGTVRFARKEDEAAEAEYRKAGDLAGTPKNPSRWGVWGLVRLGHVRDATGRRPQAVEAYRAALAYPDLWGFAPVIKGWERRPYLRDSTVGQLPPP